MIIELNNGTRFVLSGGSISMYYGVFNSNGYKEISDMNKVIDYIIGVNDRSILNGEWMNNGFIVWWRQNRELYCQMKVLDNIEYLEKSGNKVLLWMDECWFNAFVSNYKIKRVWIDV